MKKIRQFITCILILLLVMTDNRFAVFAAAIGTSEDIQLEQEPAIITGFKVPDDSCITLSSKYSLEELVSQMPETVGVYLNDSGEVTDIPVTWESEVDYEDTDYSYYLFWAKWNTDDYVLESDYNLEEYLPFMEVVLDRPGAYSTNRNEAGIDNIVARAYQQVQIAWTPLQTVNGFLDSSGTLTGVFYANTTYNGIPYGQPVYSGKYVPHNASFDTFLTAVNDPNSLFYTSRGTYGSLDAPYYSNDCSAFVSYSYGLPRMTTSTIANSSQFTAVSGNRIENAQVGDCFNKGGSHVELITGISYNSDGSIASVEVSEQTPPKARTVTYTAARVQSIINTGYTLLRFNGRYGVAEPDTYSQVTGSEIEISGQNSPGTITQGNVFSISGVVSSGKTLTNVTVGVYDIGGGMQTGKSVNPASTSYNIQNVDNDVRFNDLSPGIYCYKVIASNSEVTKTLVEKVFVVLATGYTINPGTYVIETSYNSALAIDIADHSDASGANVQLGNKSRTPYQAFWLKKADGGYYDIIDCASGKYLDVSDASSVSGTNVQQYNGNSSSAQKWQVLPVGDYYCFVPECGTSLCMDVTGGEKGAGTNIEVYTANLTRAQLFNLTEADDNFQTDNKISFDLQGGAIEGAFASCVVNHVNAERGTGENIIYNVPGSSPGTNHYGAEAAVGSDGKVQSIREWGSDTQLVVPDGGFVISGPSENDMLMSGVVSGDYLGYNYDTKIASAYHSIDGYLMENKYVASDGTYGTLPVPTREGYVFEGWYTSASGGTKITGTSTYSVSNLYAHWKAEEPECEHEFTEEILSGNCQEYISVKYTCTKCGYTYTTTAEDSWSDWSAAYPEGVDESRIENRTEYRYSDYETQTSYATSLSGYDQISSRWVQSGSGTIDYVKSWPSGFYTGNSLYSQYNKTPRSASETTTGKTTVSESVAGYIYWHWCRGTYTNGPINRKTSTTKTSEFGTFHAFYSTTAPGSLTGPADDGSYTYANASCCKDSHWYYPIAVYRQNYTEYKKEFTYARWTDWSEWSTTAYTASDTRKVEERTVYRYNGTPYGEHSYDAGVVTKEPTITSDGIRTYTCTICGETKEEAIPYDFSCGGQLKWSLSGGILIIRGTGAMSDWPSSEEVPWYGERAAITNIIVEEGVTTIGDWAFGGLGMAASVSLPSTLISIGASSFRECSSLESIAIPGKVSSIGGYAFRYCSSLKEIHFEGGAPEISSNAFYGVEATAYYPAGEATWTAATRGDYGGTLTWKIEGGQVLAITSQPSDYTGAAGETAVFTVEAVGEGLSYQWQYQNAGATVWKASGQAGSTTGRLSVPITAARNGQKYRCVVTDGAGNQVTSNAAALYVESSAETALSITSQPSDYTGAAGDTAIFTVKASGENLSYQWQYQNAGTTVWKASGQSGNTTNSLRVPITEARNGQKYRCVIMDGAGNQVTSEAGTLYVGSSVGTTLSITSQPSDYTGPAGDTAVFTVEASGESLSYQWQYQNAGTTVWKASGQAGNTTNSLCVPITVARNGQKYRCVVTDGAGNQVVSAEAALYVGTPASGLTITSQPSDYTGKVGETAVFAVKATGDGLTYQWQYQNVGTTVWKASGQAGNMTNTLSVPITAARNGQKYRCVITDASGNVLTTDAVALNVAN